MMKMIIYVVMATAISGLIAHFHNLDIFQFQVLYCLWWIGFWVQDMGSRE